ncbi:hypothetical protein XENORESO_007791, partial [Xenotaenia resolanae]
TVPAVSPADPCFWSYLHTQVCPGSLGAPRPSPAGVPGQSPRSLCLLEATG